MNGLIIQTQIVIRKLICIYAITKTQFCNKDFLINIYCPVSGLAWLIIMGSGINDWIYWHFFTITLNYGSSYLMTLYDSLHSLPDWTVTNGEGLFSAHTLNSLTNESITGLTSRRPEYRSPSQTVSLSFYPRHGNVFVNIRWHGNLCLGICYLLTASPREYV
jgi:hypothetical protein